MVLDTWSATDIWPQWMHHVPLLWTADLWMCLLSKAIGKKGLDVSDEVSDAGGMCCAEHNPYRHLSYPRWECDCHNLSEPIFAALYLRSSKSTESRMQLIFPCCKIELRTKLFTHWAWLSRMLRTVFTFVQKGDKPPPSRYGNTRCEKMENEVSGTLCFSIWFYFL